MLDLTWIKKKTRIEWEDSKIDKIPGQALGIACSASWTTFLGNIQWPFYTQDSQAAREPVRPTW